MWQPTTFVASLLHLSATPFTSPVTASTRSWKCLFPWRSLGVSGPVVSVEMASRGSVAGSCCVAARKGARGFADDARKALPLVAREWQFSEVDGGFGVILPELREFLRGIMVEHGL